MTRYFEDIEVGDTHEHGSYTVTEEELLEFAEQYDPQPFHVDEEAAENSVMRGLTASGWHTASMCMRLFVELMHDIGWASQGARGIDDLRWIRPVRPGDALSIEIEVLEKRESEVPGVGEVEHTLTGYRDDGEEAVIAWVAHGLIARRDADLA